MRWEDELSIGHTQGLRLSLQRVIKAAEQVVLLVDDK